MGGPKRSATCDRDNLQKDEVTLSVLAETGYPTRNHCSPIDQLTVASSTLSQPNLGPNMTGPFTSDKGSAVLRYGRQTYLLSLAAR